MVNGREGNIGGFLGGCGGIEVLFLGLEFE
jgi:hypothetical protein